jgi:pyrimidine-nucleoside phosphorylase
MKNKKNKSIRSVPSGNLSLGHFLEVFPTLFPSPTTKIKAAFQAFLEWNKALSVESGPRIVFFSPGQRSDLSALVLPFLIASAGVKAPTILCPPLHFWNRLSRLTGMNLMLSSSDFSHFLDLKQTAICLPAGETENPDWKKTKISTDFLHSYLQTVFLILCQSSPHFAVFDIKMGGEKYLQTMEQGFELAERLQKLCAHLHIKSASILSDFHQPMGQSLGEFLNLREGLTLLNGSGPYDLLKLILELGTAGLKMTKPQTHPTEIKTFLKNLLISGKVKQKAREIIVQQGGTIELFDTLSSEPVHLSRFAIASPQSGYVQRISWTKALALQQKLEEQHPDCGIVFLKKIGDPVASGDSLGQIYLPEGKARIHLDRDFLDLFSISSKPVTYRPLILGRL